MARFLKYNNSNVLHYQADVQLTLDKVSDSGVLDMSWEDSLTKVCFNNDYFHMLYIEQIPSPTSCVCGTYVYTSNLTYPSLFPFLRSYNLFILALWLYVWRYNYIYFCSEGEYLHVSLCNAVNLIGYPSNLLSAIVNQENLFYAIPLGAMVTYKNSIESLVAHYEVNEYFDFEPWLLFYCRGLALCKKLGKLLKNVKNCLNHSNIGFCLKLLFYHGVWRYFFKYWVHYYGVLT